MTAEERVLALLAVAYGEAVWPSVLDSIRRASKHWSRGQVSVALIQLAYTGLPKLPDPKEASFRLFLADRALAAGVTPHDLLKACGIDSGPLNLLKAGYNPNQPRVPAGNPDGGQWTDSEPNGSSSEEPTHSRLIPVDYTPVHELPSDAKVIIPRDGVPVLDPDSPTKFLMAPPRADFREVYAAGRATKSLPFSEQYARARRYRAGGNLRLSKRRTEARILLSLRTCRKLRGWRVYGGRRLFARDYKSVC